MSALNQTFSKSDQLKELENSYKLACEELDANPDAEPIEDHHSANLRSIQMRAKYDDFLNQVFSKVKSISYKTDVLTLPNILRFVLGYEPSEELIIDFEAYVAINKSLGDAKYYTYKHTAMLILVIDNWFNKQQDTKNKIIPVKEHLELRKELTGAYKEFPNISISDTDGDKVIILAKFVLYLNGSALTQSLQNALETDLKWFLCDNINAQLATVIVDGVKKQITKYTKEDLVKLIPKIKKLIAVYNEQARKDQERKAEKLVPECISEICRANGGGPRCNRKDCARKIYLNTMRHSM